MRTFALADSCQQMSVIFQSLQTQEILNSIPGISLYSSPAAASCFPTLLGVEES